MNRPVYILPDAPSVPPDLQERIQQDYIRYGDIPLDGTWESFLADRYQLDVGTHYAGCPIKNPWGKASGQLSMTARQVEEDCQAGLGFVVLKTVIAQNAAGSQSMQDWAVKEARMVAEPIVGRSGEQGWTISWKGRGWWQSFDDYLQLIRDSRRIAGESGPLIVPSCKYHLPSSDEDEWNTDEYQYTTDQLLAAWNECSPDTKQPMPLEKDFSPTLAGSGRAAVQEMILDWLRRAPELISAAAGSPGESKSIKIRVGLKLFNALFDDAFQLEMLRTIHQPGLGRPDFFIYGNRLFDPQRTFDGHQGIAYGGPDLSDRNLRVMTQFRHDSSNESGPLPWSATGNINSGKMALEYALRGASSFQIHTYFQLPAEQYTKTTGNKVQKALHELILHPRTGFVVWMHHLAEALQLPNTPIRFTDVIGAGPALASSA
jgi:hypothetical protein